MIVWATPVFREDDSLFGPSHLLDKRHFTYMEKCYSICGKFLFEFNGKSQIAWKRYPEKRTETCEDCERYWTMMELAE